MEDKCKPLEQMAFVNDDTVSFVRNCIEGVCRGFASVYTIPTAVRNLARRETFMHKRHLLTEPGEPQYKFLTKKDVAALGATLGLLTGYVLALDNVIYSIEEASRKNLTPLLILGATTLASATYEIGRFMGRNMERRNSDSIPFA